MTIKQNGHKSCMRCRFPQIDGHAPASDKSELASVFTLSENKIAISVIP